MAERGLEKLKCYACNGKNPEPQITKFMKLDDLENMLNTLNKKIVKRSIEMTKIIDKENQCG